MWSSRWLLVVVLMCAVAAPAAAARPKSISAAAAFQLPATGHCLAQPQLKLKIRAIRRVRWKSVTVLVNGKRHKAPRSALRSKAFMLTGLPSGTLALKITARAVDGRSATANRTYHTCVTQRAPRPAPAPTVTPSPTPTLTPTPTATATPTPVNATPPAPGSYSATNYGLAFSFFVAADSAQVQDVSVTIDMTCTPGTGLRDQMPIGEIPIAADGSFTSVTTRQNLVGSTPATYTYTFNGRFTGNAAAGTMREDVTYDDGVAHACTSGDRAFASVRDANQGAQQILGPGSYSATDYGLAFGFFMSPDGRHMQDVAVTVDLDCAPGTGLRDEIQIDDIAVGADGSFTGSGEQHGLIAHTAATLDYTFTGHFHGTDGTGRPRVGGIMREEIRYDDGIARTCYSNVYPWRAVRDTSQGAQGALSPVPAGSYSATNYGLAFQFFVSPDGAKLQDVAITIDLECAPGGGFRDRVLLDEIPIAADGSFSATGNQNAVISNSAAKLSYAIRGHVHGFDVNGRPRIAGIAREDAMYDDGVARTCSTNDLAWRAVRDTQGTVQTLSPPPAGTYGATNYGLAFAFHVAPDGGQLQNVAITIDLNCVPGSGFRTQLTMDGIAIGSDGSFNASVEKDGTTGAFPAHFTFALRGHFHGTATNGTARVAGIARASATYNDGTPRTCTSNDLAWVAQRTGA